MTDTEEDVAETQVQTLLLGSNVVYVKLQPLNHLTGAVISSKIKEDQKWSSRKVGQFGSGITGPGCA